MDQNMKGYELYEADRLVRKTLPVVSAGEGIYVIMRFSDLKQRMLKLSIISSLILILIGLWAMALLALFLFRKGHAEGLDDISPVSKRKKISAYLTMILAFICLPIPMYF